MPYFDFKCEECEAEHTELMKWSKTMEDELEPCECGAKKWKRFYKPPTIKRNANVSENDRIVGDMIGKGWR